jgi:hypothetical protein
MFHVEREAQGLGNKNVLEKPESPAFYSRAFILRND